MADLEARLEDGALWLTLNRPHVFNAITAEMADDVAARLEACAADERVRVVVLTGVGDAFSAGADISDGAGQQLDTASVDRASRIVRAITGLDRPVLAAVNGVAAGVGCSAALAADLVVARESASFLLAFARIGLMPDGGATATAAASIGRARAMRMALLAEPLSALEAHRAGLVSHVAADDAFDDLVTSLVRRLTAGAPLALAATKKAVNAATLTQLEAALERERSGQAALLRTRDAAEGMQAFTEKRRPDFAGG